MTDLSYLTALIKGFLIGLLIAVPIGPISLLCIQRTLRRGRLTGLVSWCGMAVGDTLYAAVAIFSISFVADLMVQYEDPLQLAGAVLLCVLGVRTYRKRPVPRDNVSVHGYIRHFTSVMALTLTNPFTIVAFAALFAAFGVSGRSHGSILRGDLLVLGVLCGTASWGFFLSAMFSRLRERFTEEGFRHLNHVSGVIICMIGVVLFFSLLGEMG